MAYEKLNLKNGTTFNEEHLSHIEDAIYNISIGGDGSNLTKNVRLYLPKIIRWETNKPLYIFKHCITNAFNYENYNIQVLMSDDATKGKDYHRYFTYTPTAEKTVILTFNLYDTAHNLIDTKNVSVIVKNSTVPSTAMKVLFIGDSLVYYNRITDEFYRVLTSSDTATTAKDTISIYDVFKPAGRKSSNVSLIGTQKLNYKGWIGQTKHEGRSGWGWNNFIGSNSPFYSGGKLNFSTYFATNGTPDVVYIGLGWNDTRNIPISDTDVDINVSTTKTQAKTFLDALTSQYPNLKIRLWTQNVPGVNGGIGNHVYGAIQWADEHRLKRMMFRICEMYEELAELYANVEVVWTTCMIDSEYALQESESAINYRIASKEVLGIDYVHPADAGFFQIADGIVSDFMHCLDGSSGGDINYDNVEATEIQFYASPEGNAPMYYQDVFKYFSNATLEELGAQIVIADVSAYVGKQIKLTAATSVVTGAYYAMFTSKLPTGLDAIENLSSFTATGYNEDKTDMLEFFNISNVDKTTKSLVITVPQGTKYVVFENLSNYCATPFVGVVTE
jgi:hypothetical protein